MSPRPFLLRAAPAFLAPLLLAGVASAQFFGPMASLKVDTSRASVPLSEIISGGPPPNGIPPLGFVPDFDTQGLREIPLAPFVTVSQAAQWLNAREPVMVVEIGAEAKAYPIQILTWHEIANDTVGGVPVAVTFCPLCNTALVFDRRIDLSGEALARALERNPRLAQTSGPVTVTTTFGVSGLLYNSDLVMFDAATHTLWTQILGEGIVGTLTGSVLERIPTQMVAFGDFAETFPAGMVLSRETGFRRDYGRNPYTGYDRPTQAPFLFREAIDGRLPAMERVVALTIGESDLAFPFTALREVRAVNEVEAGVPFAVLWSPGTTSALDQSSIAASRDVGATGVFDRRVDGRVLTFEPAETGFRDLETGSTWTLLGRATAGPLAGAQLERIEHGNHFWFAWAAFKPDVRIWTP
jgi:hypothetical protein